MQPATATIEPSEFPYKQNSTLPHDKNHNSSAIKHSPVNLLLLPEGQKTHNCDLDGYQNIFDDLVTTNSINFSVLLR